MSIRMQDEIETWIIAQLADRLRLAMDEINANESPLRYGADSLTLVTIAGDLEVWLDRMLPPSLLWEYPTIASLASALAEGSTETAQQTPSDAKLCDQQER